MYVVELLMLRTEKSWSQDTARDTRLVPSSQCPCCGHADETHQHVVLHRPHYAALRLQLRERLVSVCDAEKVSSWEQLSDEHPATAFRHY